MLTAFSGIKVAIVRITEISKALLARNKKLFQPDINYNAAKW